MKALHIISGGDNGGAKTHVFALLDALKKYIEVRIVCLIPGPFYQEIKEMDIDSVLLEQKSRLDLSVVSKIAAMVKNEGFDLVHVHGARANFISALLKGRRLGVPVITTVHSDYRLDFSDSAYKNFFYAGLNKLALRTVDYYIGVSEQFRRMLIDRGFAPNRVFTVYNGMDYDVPTPFTTKENFAARYRIPYNPSFTYVGIIGRFDKVKGHETFIKGAAAAASKNGNLRFLLAGEGPEKAHLEELAQTLGIRDKVYFLGYIKDVFSFINFIDINTLTSESESFPYVLLEGAKFSKPTISSDVGGISDLITDGETGLLFKSGNYAEFAEKLLEAASEKTRALIMGQNLYERATAYFSSDNLARTHVGIYRRIINDYKDTKHYDVVLSGYYGFKNNGDEALLYAIIQNLRALKKDIRILVLSARARETRRTFAVDSMNRFNIFSVLMAYRRARLLLSGGGTLIHDATSTQSLYYYLFTIWLAKKKGLKVMMYANGYGPLKDKNVDLAAKVTDTVDYITLRDDMSFEEMRNKKVTNPNVEVTADPAITLEKAPDKIVSEVFSREGIPEGEKLAAVCVRKWGKNDPLFNHKIAGIADYIWENYGIKTVFIPFKPSEDVEISEDIIKKMNGEAYIIKKEYPSQIVMGIISRCEFIIGMRLHSLIYAAAVEVPSIGLVYDPKINGFLNYINQEYTANIKDLNVEYLRDSVSSIIENQRQIKASLSKSTAELKKKALRNAEIAISLLEEEKETV